MTDPALDSTLSYWTAQHARHKAEQRYDAMQAPQAEPKLAFMGTWFTRLKAIRSMIQASRQKRLAAIRSMMNASQDSRHGFRAAHARLR
jgi:hypothetical protein